MKFFAATLLAVAAAAVKIQQDDAELPPPAPKQCPDEPTDATAEELFDLVDQDGSGDIDEAEGLAALFCAHEYGWIQEEDFDAAITAFEDAAGTDGKVDGGEAKKAMKKAMPASGDELAQEEGKKRGPKPDGSGSDSGLDSGLDIDDLPPLPSDIESEDVEELLDEDLAQKSGPPRGEGSYELPSGLDELPSGLESEDLEDLAQEEGEGP